MFKYKGMSLQAAQLRKRARNLPPLITNVIPPNNTIINNPIQIITITFNKNIQPGTNYNNITVKNSLGIAQTITKTINNNKITITPNTPLNNLLTPNQQTGTDTLANTTGFNPYKGTTITSSTEQAHTGTRSLKCTTPGTTGNEGLYIPGKTVTPSTKYIISAWVYAPIGATMTMLDGYGGGNIIFTGTGTWQYIEKIINTKGTTASIMFWTNSPQSITFYVDDLHFAKNVDDYSILIPTNSITDLAGNPLQDPLNSTFTVNTV